MATTWSGGPLTILTFASSNYLHWLAHLHVNFQQLRLRDASLLVCTTDDASRAAAHSRGLATIDVRDTAGCSLCPLLGINATTTLSTDSLIKDEGETWGTTTYTHMVHAKSVCVHLHVERHERQQGLLLFVDTDVTLFSDPRSHVHLEADIALLLDIGPGVQNFTHPDCAHFDPRSTSSTASYFNSGFFFMRYTPVIRQLWRRMLQYHADNPKVMQQAALNTLLKQPEAMQEKSCKGHAASSGSCSESHWHIMAHGLDPRRFLSGYCFYEQLPIHARLAPSISQRLEPDAVVAVHHNWIKGDRHKWTRAVETSVVAVNNTPGFLDRARSSMKAGVYWDAYEQSTPRSCDLAPRSPPVLGGMCQSGPPPRLCLTHSPVALWSFPGTGNTWLRLAIELATGIKTGSIYGIGFKNLRKLPAGFRGMAKRAAMQRLAWKMSAEGSNLQSQADCAGMAVVTLHGMAKTKATPDWQLDYSTPWVKFACGGTLSRAVFLARHPFVTIWASLLARYARDPAINLRSIQPKNRTHNFWSPRLRAAAVATARQWRSMVNGQFRGYKHVDWSWRMWRRRGRGSAVFRIEDFQDPGRASYELRRLIDYVLAEEPMKMSIKPRLRCALKRATQMHDAHRNGSLVMDRDQARRVFEDEQFQTGDAIWRVVSNEAEELGYSRHGYYELMRSGNPY